MVVIVGLGNPGKKYQKTWHNIGFLAVEEFQKRNKFPLFRLAKKFSSLVSEDILKGEKIILAKPQTFMNESGRAVKSLAKFYNTTRTVLVVVHDDIDLPLGKIRIVKNRGAAGHKGVESIIKAIGKKDFIRFRIGIQSKDKPGDVEKYVLQKFGKEEEKIIKEAIEKTAEAIKIFLSKGAEKAMNEYNKFNKSHQL